MKKHKHSKNSKFEENEKASQDDSTSVRKINFDRNKRSSDHNRIPFNQNNQNISCYTCGESGHKSNNCSKSKQRIKLWCGHCRSSTHSDKACRKKHSKDVAARVSNNTERKNNNDEHDFAFCVSEDNYLLKVSENSILVDCGATTQIINDDSQFVYTDKSYIPEEHFIELADGSCTNNIAKKRGTVVVDIQDEYGIIRKATLNNALYIPSYPQNIFSVQAAAEKGAKVNFNADSGELVNKDGVKFPIQKHGRLYYLCKTSTDNVRSGSFEAWHKILGHCNKGDVENLEKVV